MDRPTLNDETRAMLRVAHPRAVVLVDPEGELPDLVLRRPSAKELRAFNRLHSQALKGRDELPEEEDDAFQEEHLPRILEALKLFPDQSVEDLLRVWPELELSAGAAIGDLFQRTARRIPKASL